MLPAASYRRPAFEPINLADADFGIEPATASTKSDLLHNSFIKSIEPEEIKPLLDIDFTSNENIVDSILDVNDEYQYQPFNSIVPPEPCCSQETLKDFRPDILESHDSVKESDKNHSIDSSQRLPDVATCPVLINSPDSSKDDYTISSELQSLNTSEICDVDSTNADYSDGELYKCLQEYEEREDLLSINCNGNSSADVITPQSEFSDELIAEKPLICDDSVSETKDTLSSEASNDLLEINDYDEPQDDTKNQSLLTEEEKVILEEILEDSLKLDFSYEENNTDELLENDLENVLEVAVECEVTKDNLQDNSDELKDIPSLPIAINLNFEVEFQDENSIKNLDQHQIEEKSLSSDLNNELVIESNEVCPKLQIECVHLPEKELTDSLCSIESTETILLKDDNQVSANTVTDSLDSQSTCSLPSEVIGDIIENVEDGRVQRPNTLALNGTTDCETELQSTLSTGIFQVFVFIISDGQQY